MSKQDYIFGLREEIQGLRDATLFLNSEVKEKQKFLSFIRKELGDSVYNELKKNFRRMKENDK